MVRKCHIHRGILEKLFPSALHITPHRCHNTLGIFFLCPMQHLSGFAISDICNRTGIDDTDICRLSKFYNVKSMFLKICHHFFCFIKIHFTTKG